MFSENKLPVKWLALLASAAGTPWMVHETTQIRDRAVEVSSSANDSAQALLDSAKGTLKDWESMFASSGENARATSQNADSWSLPSDPNSLSQPGYAGQQTFSQAGYNPQNAAAGQLAGLAGTQRGSLPTMAPQPVDFREFFRFDATPDWVVQKYGRVSTVTSEKELDGYRVVLVTGAGLRDLAGTLTYYFDKYRQVQRLEFQGVTGDPSVLIDLMTRYYYFVPRPVLGSQLYLVTWNTTPTGIMEVTRAGMVYSANQNGQFKVYLEINQPNVPGGLSDIGEKIIQRHLGEASVR
jgi:hypothetical protein